MMNGMLIFGRKKTLEKEVCRFVRMLGLAEIIKIRFRF
jgi:hypothetical protein